MIEFRNQVVGERASLSWVKLIMALNGISRCESFVSNDGHVWILKVNVCASRTRVLDRALPKPKYSAARRENHAKHNDPEATLEHSYEVKI